MLIQCGPTNASVKFHLWFEGHRFDEKVSAWMIDRTLRNLQNPVVHALHAIFTDLGFKKS